MPNGLEIERKFLVGMPDLSLLDVRREVSILQIYLVNGENGSQRRVRRIDEMDDTRYVYTEKEFITPVTRRENEKDITREEFVTLLKQVRKDCVPIEKTRVCFFYKEQMFELDVYPFSQELAILELELQSAEQEIEFPPEITVIKEVTGEEEYSNANLANAGGFPGEKI